MTMYVVVVVGICIITYLGYKNWVGRSGETYLLSIIRAQNMDLEDAAENYQKLELGRDDQEENYEQQFLTFKEKIAELEGHLHQRDTDIIELEARLEQHDRECLPILQETRWQALSASVENA